MSKLSDEDIERIAEALAKKFAARKVEYHFHPREEPAWPRLPYNAPYYPYPQVWC